MCLHKWLAQFFAFSCSNHAKKYDDIWTYVKKFNGTQLPALVWLDLEKAMGIAMGQLSI